MQVGLQVVEFYSKLMGLWNELENYVSFHTVPATSVNMVQVKA